MRCVGRGDFDVLCCAVLCSRYCYRHSSTTYALTTLLVATMLTAALRLRSEMAALHQRTLPITSKTNNEHCPEYLPHCWLDGLEAHLLDVCSSVQPTTTISVGVLSVLLFPCHIYVTQYVRTNTNIIPLANSSRTYKTNISRLAVLSMEILCIYIPRPTIYLSDLR